MFDRKDYSLTSQLKTIVQDAIEQILMRNTYHDWSSIIIN